MVYGGTGDGEWRVFLGFRQREMRQSSSTSSNSRHLARSESASASKCCGITSWILGGAILVYAAAQVVWQHHIINFGNHAATLKDNFPHFVQEKDGTKTTAIAPLIDAHDTGDKNNVMQYYRTPAQILSSPQLPTWVKQYTDWHAKQRQRYLEAVRTNAPLPEDIRFLISRCLSYDHCGGASDRLQDMPYNMMLANQTNRVLLVKWEKPAALEHYLVPPEGGINWSIPDDMFKDGDNWHRKGKETGRDRIVSTIRRDSAAPLFRKVCCS